jgi:hypothetical protein
MATTTNSRIGDVDRMVNKLMKLSDDYDAGKVAPESVRMKTRIASGVFSGISLRRKLIHDARQAEIDVTPKPKALKSKES